MSLQPLEVGALTVQGKQLLDFFYPVGTIYETTSSSLDTVDKMADYFGGTWEVFGQGRVIIGAGTYTEDNETVTYSVNGTGGSKNAVSIFHSHTLSINDKALTIKLLGSNEGNLSDDYCNAIHWSSGNRGMNGLGGPNDDNAKNKKKSYYSTDAFGKQLVSVDNHNHTGTVSTDGVSGTDKNLQPYITVYRYRRTR